jgi:hypothetical protein
MPAKIAEKKIICTLRWVDTHPPRLKQKKSAEQQTSFVSGQSPIKGWCETSRPYL